MRFFPLLALCLALCATVFADRISLNDGREYEGLIVEETETAVKIRTVKATLSIPKSQIASIDRASGGEMLIERERKLEALDGKTGADYLAAAEWLTGEGREVLDMQILRRLCHAAASLDRTIAAEAMILLGKELAATGIRAEACRAFLRALKADPDSAPARRMLAQQRQILEEGAKKELADFRGALDLVLKKQYEDAAPRLRKYTTAFFADESGKYLGMSPETLAADIHARTPCKICSGTGIVSCPVCGGDGVFACSVCDGAGRKTGSEERTELEAFRHSVCRTCSGLKTVLCTNCGAARDVLITFVVVPSRPPPNTHPPVTIHTVAGRERKALKIELDLDVYKPTDGTEIPVKDITPLEVTAGGKTSCKACEGVKFVPPVLPVNTDGITAWIASIDQRLAGHQAIEILGAVDGVFDAALLSDRLTYKSGKWIR